MSTRSRDQPLPLRQMGDDGEVLRDEYRPNRDWDCDDYWLALGSTLQVARSAAAEKVKSRRGRERPDEEWLVSDQQWDGFVEQLEGNIREGVRTLQQNGCGNAGVDQFSLPEPMEDYVPWLDGSRTLGEDAERLESHLEELVDEWYTLAPEGVKEKLEGSNRPTGEGGESGESGGSYRMMCAEGESLSEVEMEMNDRMNDAEMGEPDSLTVNRDESLDTYYACALLKKTAEETRGDGR